MYEDQVLRELNGLNILIILKFGENGPCNKGTLKSHVKGTVHRMSIPQSQVGHPLSEVVSKNPNESVSEGKIGELCVLLLAFPRKPPGLRPNEYLM